MSLIELIKNLPSLIGAVIEVVKEVEALFPEAGKGADKLAMVRGMLEQSYIVAGNTAEQFAILWPVINVMISGAVKLMKKPA